MPLAFSAGATTGGGLPGQPLQPVSLLLTRGKHCRAEQPFAAIQPALAACLAAFSAPVAVKLTGQGLALHADGLSLTAWLSTPGAAALLSPLDAAAGGGGAASASATPVLSAALLADDVAADMQCSKAFAAVMEHEAAHGGGGGGGDDPLAAPAAAALRQRLASDIVTLSHSLDVQVCARAARAQPPAAAAVHVPCRRPLLPACQPRQPPSPLLPAACRLPSLPCLDTTGGDGTGCGAAVRPGGGGRHPAGAGAGAALRRRHAAHVLPPV